MPLLIKGYDSVKLSEKIELPDIAELIRFPFCSQVDIDDLYRNCSEDMKYILDRIPLTNKTKYISINTCTQLLSPNVTSAPRGNWHFDGDSFKEDSPTIIHLLISDCTAVTEFMEDDLVLDEFDEDSMVGEVEVALNKKLHLIKPVKAECSKFITFDGCRHFHRAVKAERFEFRFMMRVMESNVIKPCKFEESVFYEALVFDDGVKDYSTIDLDYILQNKTNPYKSIVKSRDNNSFQVYFN